MNVNSLAGSELIGARNPGGWRRGVAFWVYSCAFGADRGDTLEEEHMLRTALMVIAKEIFRDEEYIEPKLVLEDGGVRIKTTSTEAGPCIGKIRATVVAEFPLADADPNDYEAVLFIGGSGAAVFFDDPDAHRLAREMHADGKVVAAICIAPSTLAHAGLLEGRQATAFESQKDDLEAHGAVYTGNPVEVDGRIVTANGPEAATDFGKAVLELINQIAPQE
jgi:protease I